MKPADVDVSSLFEPFRRGSLNLRNRVAMAPMTRCFSPNGIPGADVADYYRRRVEGGVGLIITEGSWIPHASAANEDNAPRFYGEDALAGWSRVLRDVHAAGGAIVPQLWHVGLVRRPQAANIYKEIEEDFSQRVSPSGIVMPGEKIGAGMSLEQIDQIIAAYATAARSADEMGFDGVELHGAHGYLLDQFLWSETNKRSDAWGGDAGQRTRFVAEVVKACRASVRPDFQIILRFSQWKMQDYAAKVAETPQELEKILTPLVDAGVDVLHASQRRFWEPEFSGSDLNLAGWAKHITGKPTITVGSVGLDKELLETIASAQQKAHFSHLQRLIEMRERGEFDLVAVGRAIIANPDWANKIKAGNSDSLIDYDMNCLGNLN